MIFTRTILVSLLLLIFLNAFASPLTLLAKSQQLLVVLTPPVNNKLYHSDAKINKSKQYKATLRLYQKIHNTWTQQKISGHWSAPAVIGKQGLAWSVDLPLKPKTMPYKHEGDNRSPAGVYLLNAAFGTYKVGPVGMKYYHITADTICVDDARSKYYNKIIHENRVEKGWSSAEEMLQELPMYSLGLQVSYNLQQQPGRGSCIFVHVWRNASTGTAGCTAFDKSVMEYLFKVLKQQNYPVLVQLPEKYYLKFRKKWGLPDIQ